MAILPEETPAILTVFLTLGAWRISLQKALTRRVTAVEALGAITRTGTLTVNRMAVAELASGDQHFRPEGASDEPRIHLLATKGAPEVVADLCHLDAVRRNAIHRQVEAMAERGMRRAGRGAGPLEECRPAPDQASPCPKSQHDFDLDFLGLVALADPPRPEMPAALAECRRAGVRVIMMTGDHPATAGAIAQRGGPFSLETAADRFVSIARPNEINVSRLRWCSPDG